jgi:trans-aconitate methyltransferase
VTDRFDEAYYRQFYGRRPVHTAAKVAQLAGGVMGLCGWLGVPVRSVLDVGAGPGHWRTYLAKTHPKVRYTGVDVSEYACRRYGHLRRDISGWRPRPADLVVCQGVLQYLADDAATAAIDHLGAATRGALYLEVPTSYDRVATIDPDHTDLAVHWRDGRWYRSRLDPWFQQVGGGIWIARARQLPLYELERAGQ